MPRVEEPAPFGRESALLLALDRDPFFANEAFVSPGLTRVFPSGAVAMRYELSSDPIIGIPSPRST